MRPTAEPSGRCGHLSNRDILEGPAKAMFSISPHYLFFVLLPTLLVIGGCCVSTLARGWVSEDEALAAGHQVPEGLHHNVHEAVVMPHAERAGDLTDRNEARIQQLR